jgi:hypothetical protein
MPVVDLDQLRAEAELLRDEWNRGLWIPHPDAYGDDCRANAGAVAEGCLAVVAEMEMARSDMHRVMHHFGAMRIQIRNEHGDQAWEGTLAEWLRLASADA